MKKNPQIVSLWVASAPVAFLIVFAIECAILGRGGPAIAAFVAAIIAAPCLAIIGLQNMPSNVMLVTFLFGSPFRRTIMNETVAQEVRPTDKKTRQQLGGGTGLFGSFAYILPGVYRTIRVPSGRMKLAIRQTRCITRQTGKSAQVQVLVDCTIYLALGSDLGQLFRNIGALNTHQDLAKSCPVRDKYWAEVEGGEQRMHEYEGDLATQILLRAAEEVIRAKIAEAVNAGFTYGETGSDPQGEYWSLENNRNKLEEQLLCVLREEDNVLVSSGLLTDIGNPIAVGLSALSFDLKVEDIEWPKQLVDAGTAVPIATQEGEATVIREKALGEGRGKAAQELAAASKLTPEEAARLNVAAGASQLNLFGADIVDAVGGRKKP